MAKKATIKGPIKKELPPLNEKEERFCVEYAANDNAVKSFMYVWPSYSYNAARTESSRALQRPDILARVVELKEERRKALTPTVDKVLAELCKLAFYDPRAFFDDDGRLKPLSELDDDTAMALCGIETFHKIIGDNKDGMAVVQKIKIADKGANLERLGRHLKLFTDKIEVDVSDSLAVAMKAARERIKGQG